MFVIGIPRGSYEATAELEDKLSGICESFGFKHRICTYDDTEELRTFLENVYIEEGDSSSQENEHNQYIELFYQRFKYRIRCKDIKYIEAYNGYTEFLVGNKRFRREESLKEIEQMLDMSLFVKIQRAYIVNLAHVKSYENMEVLVGEERLAVSRRRRRAFEEIYTNYHISTEEK